MSATEIPRRWPLIVALLADPVRESRRLIAELDRWPAPGRRHSILDAGGRPPAEAAPKNTGAAGSAGPGRGNAVPIANRVSDAPTLADQVQREPAQPKARKPHARGAARFSAKRWIAEREARLERERDA